MKIQSITLYHVAMPMKFTFKTAQGAINHRDTIILKVEDGRRNCGYGECVAFREPFYTSETFKLAWSKLEHSYAPSLVGKNLSSAKAIHNHIHSIDKYWKRTPMAIAALENALLDLESREKGKNIVSYVMQEELIDSIPLGVVAGDLPIGDLLEFVATYVEQGCQRIKLKIKPGDAVERVAAVRDKYPHLGLAVDANQAFSLEEIDHQAELYELDEMGLLCIEEPFRIHSFTDYDEAHMLDDFCLHTPICFDESVMSMDDLLDAADIMGNGIAPIAVNVKVGRLGGLYPAKSIIDYCRKHAIKYWIGSMVESSISKIMHAQLAGLGDTYMAGDLSDSSRYFVQDLTKPALVFSDGFMPLPKGPGLGVEVDAKTLLTMSQRVVVIE